MNIQIVKPQPGPQAAFIQCTADVVCYGGARGGGKSWAIALDFWLHAERYGEDARGLILRKTREDLKDFIDSAGHMYAGSARYSEKGCHVESVGPQDVGVGGGVHAAVDVLGATDVDRPEVAGDRARRQHGLRQPGRRRAHAPEDDSGPVAAPRRADAQAVGPPAADVFVEPSGALGDVDATPRQEGHGSDVGSEGQRAPEDPCDARGGRQGPRVEQGTDGRRGERLGVVREDAAQDGAAALEVGTP